MQHRRRLVRSTQHLFPWLPLAAGVACAGDESRPRELAVQWDTLATGVVYAQCERLPQEPRWTIDADLRIGSVDGSGEAAFGEVRGIAVDDRGRVLVLDYQASEIRAFDADGRFVELIASSGEGPREISTANGIRLDAHGALWINDHGRMRLTRLLPDGEVETYPVFVPGFSFLWEGGITDDGRVWSRWTHTERGAVPPEPGVYLGEDPTYYKSFDPSSGTLDSTPIGPAPYHTIVAPRGMMRVPFSATLLHALDPAGYIWTAVSSEYRLTKQRTDGDTLVVVVAGCEAPLVPAEERRQAIDRAERFMQRAGTVSVDWGTVLPDWEPVLQQLAVDDRGRLWAVRGEADRYVLDVFDPDGQFLGTVEPAFDFVPSFPLVVRDDRLYVLQRDSLDVPFVVRAELPALP